jgi:hypothetical protein
MMFGEASFLVEFFFCLAPGTLAVLAAGVWGARRVANGRRAGRGR